MKAISTPFFVIATILGLGKLNGQICTVQGPYCEGNNLTVQTPTPGCDTPVTFTWTGPSCSPLPCTTATINNVMVGVYNVTVTSQGTDCCTDTLTVEPTPVVSITSSNSNMCVGDNKTLVGNPAGGTFTVESGPGSISNGTTLTALGAGTINIKYTYASMAGCSNSVTQAILVVAPPSISLTSGSSTQSKCLGNPIDAFSYTITNATGANVSGLPTNVFGNFNNGIYTISGTPMQSGTFNFTVTVAGATAPCTSAPQATGTLTISPPPSITLSSGTGTNTQTRCVNTPITAITFTIANATGAALTSGSFPNGVSGVYNNGTFTISGTPSQSGTFNYTITTSGGGVPPCSNATIGGTLTVIAQPTINLSSGSGTNTQTKCLSEAITNITYSIGGGANNASVTGLPNNVSGSYSNGVFTISGTPDQGGVFNYTVITSGGSPCSAVTATGTITVNDVAAGSLNEPAAVCANADPPPITESSAASGLGMVNYQWQSNTSGCTGTFNDIVGATQSSYDPPANPSQTTYFRRRVTYLLNGVTCTKFSNCVTMTVKPVPVMNTIDDIGACSGDPIGPINFSSTPTDPTTEYKWTNSNISIGLPVMMGTGNIGLFNAPNVSMVQTAMITVTPTLAGCTGNSTSFTITVATAPSFSDISNVSGCSGEVKQVNITGTQNATVQFFYDGQNYTTTLDNNGQGAIDINLPIVTSPQNVNVTATIELGCSGLTKIFSVTTNPRPGGITVVESSGNGTGDGTICQGSAVTLNVFDGTSCNWTSDNGEPTPSACNASNIFPSATTTYSVTATNSLGCTSTDTEQITVIPEPQFQILVENPCIGQNLTLKSSDNTFQSYIWKRDGVQVHVGSQYTVNNATAAASGAYSLQVKDNQGCTWTVEKTVFVAPIPSPQLSAAIAEACINQQNLYRVTNPTSQQDSRFQWKITPSISNSSVEQMGELLWVHWKSPGQYTIEVTEVLGDDFDSPCRGVATLNVTVSNEMARDTAPIFQYAFNNLHIVKDAEATCYQWGYYDTLSYELKDEDQEKFQAYPVGAAFQSNRIYWVKTWGGDCNGCATLSFRTYQGTTPPPTEPAKFLLYPNPNKGTFKLEITDLPERAYTLVISDVWGRELMRSSIATNNGAIDKTIEMVGLANGFYRLLLIGDKTIYRAKSFAVIQ